MNTTFIFGHKCPDTDSICSSIVLANLLTSKGKEVQACRLGAINDETRFVLDHFGAQEPVLLEELTEENVPVILVDHNEFTQTIPGIEKASIKMVVDHHRIANFQTSDPLYYIAEPVGCTCTILYELYKKFGIEIDEEIAGLMLSAIISDTLLFKSPTCTPQDKTVATELSKIAEINLDTYGLDMLKAGTNLSKFSAEELIHLDCKEFSDSNLKFQVAQVNTACIEDVLVNKSEIETAISTTISNDSLDLFVFLITDIINSNSQAIVLGNHTNIFEKAFGKSLVDHMAFLEGVVSRKKQVGPALLKSIN